MKKMAYPFRKAWGVTKGYSKALLVFTAFLIMVMASCVIMSNTLSGKLTQHADETMNDIQSYLTAELRKPETALHFFADTIQGMIGRGEDAAVIKAYMEECSSETFKETIHMNSYKSIFGYFDVFDEFYDGMDFEFPEGFSFKDRPWYTNAVAAGNEIVLSKVYLDARMDILTMFYSRGLFDSGGRFLGVLAMSVPIQGFQQIISNEHFTQGSFGSVMDEEMVLIMHPNEDSIGLNLAEVNPNFVEVKDLLDQGVDISMARIRDYRNVKSFLFCRRLPNNWYISFMIPQAEYYRELYQMMWVISLLGLFMALVLSALLLKMDSARSKADIKNREKSNFLTIMSHEIRTPMNAIMGIAEAQLQEEEALPRGIRDAFDRIYYSGNLLLQIIGDILDLSKIEAGKLEILDERYEVASLINEVIHINKIKFDSKPIEFKLSVDENTPASLIGDELRIKQILNNLLSNAFKYTQTGEIELSIKAEAGEGKDVTLVYTVRDTGQGISAQDIQNLFEVYTRFNSKANRSTVGTGLGLNITRNLVGLMRGDISVESELEKGSAFTVRLPQKINGAFAPLGKDVVDNLLSYQFESISQEKRHAVLQEAMPHGSVLIVDDVEMNLFVAKMLMRPYKLHIETASSGYEAIDKIKGGGVYDIVFMDHMMPKMDGIETVKQIRDWGYTRPIVALTANAVAGQADRFLTNGFDDFISKPIDVRALNTVLKKNIRDKRKEPIEIQPPKKEETRMEEGIPFVIPGLNAERGLDIFGGEEEDYIAALHSFLANAPKTVDALRGVTEETLPDYTINVHGLKSICGYICAEEIQAGAQALEALAKAGDLSAVRARNGPFLKEAEAFIKALQEALEDC